MSTITRGEVAALAQAGATAPADAVLRKQYVAEDVRKAGGAGSRLRVFCVSTGAVDRDNDTVSPSGWHLDNFRKNPVVLFAHDYHSLPIGKCTDIRLENGRLVASTEFADHDMADAVLRLVDGGFLRATSVGFRPMKYLRNDERGGVDFVEQELLEFSIVPVPANPEALITMAAEQAADYKLLHDWATKIIKAADRPLLDEDPAAVAAAQQLAAGVVAKGSVPSNVSTAKAPDDEAWKRPTLQDLTDKAWADLTDAEKRKIAGHFAWADSMPPETFGALHLPHHNPKGEVVLKGVSGAAARLNQTAGVNEAAVRAHLGAHYKQFGVPAPWDKSGEPDPVPAPVPEPAPEPATPPPPAPASEEGAEPVGGAEATPAPDTGATGKAVRRSVNGYAECGYTGSASGSTSPAHVHDYWLWCGSDGSCDGGMAQMICDHLHRITPASLAQGQTEPSDGHVHALMPAGVEPTVQPGGTEPDMAQQAAVPAQAKRGRVLSRKNEQKIRAAKNHLDDVLESVADDTSGGAGDDGGADETDGATVPVQASAADVALELADTPAGSAAVVLELEATAEQVLELAEDEALGVDPGELRRALQDTVRELLGTVVREQVGATLGRMRGRVD